MKQKFSVMDILGFKKITFFKSTAKEKFENVKNIPPPLVPAPVSQDSEQHWKCHSCGEIFHTEMLYKNHASTRDKTHTVSCDEPGCGNIMTSMSMMYKHLWDLHTKLVNARYCPDCKEAIDNKNWASHEKKPHKNMCEVEGCGAKMISDNALWQHRIKKHGNRQAIMNKIDTSGLRFNTIKDKVQSVHQIHEPPKNSRKSQRNLQIIADSSKSGKDVPKRKLMEDNFMLKMRKTSDSSYKIINPDIESKGKKPSTGENKVSSILNNPQPSRRRISKSVDKSRDPINKTRDMFKCTICEFQSNYKNNLKRHEENVHKDIESKAENAVTYDHDFKEHLMNANKARRKSLMDKLHCGVNLEIESVKTKHSDNLTCKPCNRQFKCRSDIYAHYSRFHYREQLNKILDGRKACPECLVKKKTTDDLSIHIGRVHNYVEQFLPKHAKIPATSREKYL